MFLPNVLNDDVGIYKSISPIFGYFKREDTRDEVIARVVMVLSIIILSICCWVFWDYFYYCIEFISGIAKSIENWGYDKLTDYHASGSKLQHNYQARYDEHMKNIDDI